MLKKRSVQRGDTLIEVLFAVTVFSLVIVSALSIMNQGTSASQRSLEMSLVSQQIFNQTEALRFMHESYVTNYQVGYESTPNLTIAGPTGQFYKVIQNINLTNQTSPVRQASPFVNLESCPTPPRGSFIINTRTGAAVTSGAIFRPTSTYARLNFNGANPNVLDNAAGIWIEGIKSDNIVGDPSQAGTGYIDFHIRACWEAPGANAPITLGTIVRLYEPRT